MSINLSANLGSFSFKNKFAKKEETEEEKEENAKTNRASKPNPLLNVKTDPYVDDSDAYQIRYTKAEKYEYWTHLLQNRGPRRPLPKGFQSWKMRELANINAQAQYHKSTIGYFKFVTSSRWDHWSINIFIAWLLLVIFYQDRYAVNTYKPLITLNSANQILALPMVLIFFCQLIPFVGMLYFITHCNDLVHLLAIDNIGRWAFCAALTAQYVEFFLYRGQGHPERAGNCKIGHDPNPKPLLEFAKRSINLLRKRYHSKVHNKDSDSEEDSEGDEESANDGRPKAGAGKEAMAGIANSTPNKPTSAVSGKNTSDAPAVVGILKRKPSAGGGNRRKSSASFAGLDDAASAASGGGKSVRSGRSGRSKSRDFVDLDEHGNAIVKAVPQTEWRCVVCNTQNRKPTRGPVQSDVWFGEKGVYYKRTYAVIQARRDVPTCKKCGTYADYTPPLGSAHLFKYNPKPHAAFEDYPVPSAVQAGLAPDIYSRYYYAVKGFFLGIKDNINSAPLKNDWRLEKFVNNRFPELPRYKLAPGEQFQVGEIVECRQQKFDWARARVLLAHPNDTYDIRYDPGDEIRFVAGSAIRTIPEKRAYAFRVEMGLVVIAIMSPLGMGLGLISGNIGLSMVGLLMVSTTLLAIRLVMLVQYFYNYYDAGLIVVLKLASIYTLPLVFLVAASAAGVGYDGDPATWTTVAVMLILTMASSVPYLYIFRPPYLVVGGVSFVLIGLGLIGLAMYAANPDAVRYIAIPFVPFLFMAWWLKVVRSLLHNVWDVCLIIRKAKDTQMENPSIVKKVQDAVMDYVDP